MRRWRFGRRPRLAVAALAAPAALSALSAITPLLAFLLLDRLYPFPYAALRRPPAVVVEAADGTPLRFFLPADERWRLPLPLAEMGPDLPRAVVAAEDRRFGHHPGVDPLAIVRAAWQDLRAGRVVSGASTLPMQLARLADPAPRTLASKLREGFRALQLTWHRRPGELLADYLNLAPYGGNLEGVGAAAWFYFGKRPQQLSPGEIALLVALPRSPRRFDPTVDAAAARAARDRVLERLGAAGVFTRDQVSDARRQPVPTRRRPPPFAAPHFTRFAAERAAGATRIRTTLDRRLQGQAEAQVARRIDGLRAKGIGNAAVVVMENSTRAVRALIGSAGFGESAFSGQVNGALARRSPGSALKPFLYALAFDRGELLPDGYLLDVPTDFAGYVARNYDGLYRGRVTAREALVHSLNAPAVRLLADVGLDDFHRLLLRGGLTTLDRPPESYGLPLILGAGEVTLLDLTNLYATLAEGGRHRPAVWRRDAGGGEGSKRRRPTVPDPLFSAEAAWLVTDILTDLRRPDLPASWDLARGVPAVAWKTGTSFGHRDAWALGFSARLTIGVWVGNFDGRAVEGISGSEDAGPLLFDLFRALDPGGAGPRRPAALDVAPIEVCALSHQLPGPFCPQRITIPALPGRSRPGICTLHRRALVDAVDGSLLAGDCVGRRPHRWALLRVDPPELVAWWRAAGQPVPELPRTSPGCSGVAAGTPPSIVSPDAATPYRIRRDAPLGDQRIPLTARADAGSRRLYWYQDGLLVASAPPSDLLFVTPSPGVHRLVVTDDSGRSDGLTYRVE